MNEPWTDSRPMDYLEQEKPPIRFEHPIVWDKPELGYFNPDWYFSFQVRGFILLVLLVLGFSSGSSAQENIKIPDGWFEKPLIFTYPVIDQEIVVIDNSDCCSPCFPKGGLSDTPTINSPSTNIKYKHSVGN